jgi:hypothetical protein
MKSRILEKLAGAQTVIRTESANVPVDGGNNNAQGERSSIDSVYIPNGMAPLFDIITGCVEGVVEAGNYEEEPGKKC